MSKPKLIRSFVDYPGDTVAAILLLPGILWLGWWGAFIAMFVGWCANMLKGTEP
jgi:hypothetical protein